MTNSRKRLAMLWVVLLLGRVCVASITRTTVPFFSKGFVQLTRPRASSEEGFAVRHLHDQVVDVRIHELLDRRDHPLQVHDGVVHPVEEAERPGAAAARAGEVAHVRAAQDVADVAT